MKKITALFLLFVLFPLRAWATTETFYFRSDTHTVNGLSAYRLQITNTGSSSTLSSPGFASGGCSSCTYNFDVYIRHADNSETALGSGIAGTSAGGDASGESSATWTPTETNMAATDALKVVMRAHDSIFSATRTFVTDQLGWTRIDAVSWTFWRNWYSECSLEDAEQNLYLTRAHEYHGSASYDTRIEGISFSTGGARRIVSVS